MMRTFCIEKYVKTEESFFFFFFMFNEKRRIFSINYEVVNNQNIGVSGIRDLQLCSINIKKALQKLWIVQ